ncbi:MAG: MFS transporter [Pirellulaceae bacterium]
MADATAYGIMVGIGETYLPAFALAVGLGEVTAGLVASVPLLAGGIIQSISPWVMRVGVREHTWILITALIQGLAFIPLIVAAIRGTIATPWLLVFASLYWAGGLATGPAWNSWIEHMIPRGIRTNYFAGRTRASQIATLVGFLGGGFLLQTSRTYDFEVLAFAALFAMAFSARIFSVIMLAMHRWVPLHAAPKAAQPTSSTGNLGSASTKSSIAGRQLIIYLVMVQGMVQISGPFFTPYMLIHLQLTYLAYAGLIAIAFLAKIIAIGAWGRLAQRRGAGWLLLLGGGLIIPLAPLWTVSNDYRWLLLIQAINGAAWAAYELGFFLMFFEAMPRARRVKMLTVYNLANTSAWWFGAMIGAAILSHMGSTPGAYHMLFFVSCVGRAIAYLYLVTHRQRIFVKVKDIGFRILGLRANSGPLETPILTTLDDDTVADKP